MAIYGDFHYIFCEWEWRFNRISVDQVGYGVCLLVTIYELSLKNIHKNIHTSPKLYTNPKNNYNIDKGDNNMKKAWTDMKSFITVTIMLLFAYCIVFRLPIDETLKQAIGFVLGFFLGSKIEKTNTKEGK